VIHGATAVHAGAAAGYHAAGWWSSSTLADRLAANVATRPDGLAYVTPRAQLSWAQVESASDGLAGALAAIAEPGDRVAVWLPDGPSVHVAFLAAEKAGLVVVGVGARAGRREVAHLLARTGADLLVTGGEAEPAAGAVAELRRDGARVRHVTVGDAAGELATVDVDGRAVACEPLPPAERARRRIGPDDMFLINSTSGTTGLPKCVVHNQNRWHHFHQQAVANGALTGDDVFLGAVPAPFGFGLWTSHVTPITLGATTVLLDRFDAAAALAAIERERVTVLCCVSTQFIMMLGAPELDELDLSSLRVMFTGGEAVPYERARAFEERTGCTILQFYGSNETGLLSGTTLDDPPERRLRTAGRVIPEMQVRLFDGRRDVTEAGRGQPACKGPATSFGYLDDDEANAELLTEDGWMLMGDIVEVDGDGWLSVVGRTSDLIIRGGKNISAAQVEADVATHPAVAHAAVVAMPDPTFGERVCAYVELRPGASLTLDELGAHLAAQGASKELRPERLVVVDELPRSSGAKVAKGELRADIVRRLQEEQR
jgi:acyl-CoA synthetase